MAVSLFSSVSYGVSEARKIFNESLDSLQVLDDGTIYKPGVLSWPGRGDLIQNICLLFMETMDRCLGAEPEDVEEVRGDLKFVGQIIEANRDEFYRGAGKEIRTRYQAYQAYPETPAMWGLIGRPIKEIGAIFVEGVGYCREYEKLGLYLFYVPRGVEEFGRVREGLKLVMGLIDGKEAVLEEDVRALFLEFKEKFTKS